MNTRKILGGMGFLDEGDFERETSSVVSTVAKGVSEVFKNIFPSAGSIEFKNNQAQVEQLQEQQAEQLKERTKPDRKRAFFQALKEDMERTQRAKDKLLFEEEINDIITNLPTEQKNQLLHYQASYKDRSIYQRAELRKKLIEQRRKSEKQEKAVSIPNPAKQPSAMEGAFEGRSGTQGSGSANLSNQAVG